MRTELEKQLAILTLQNEREVVPEETMFGDNNYTIIDYSIDVINGKIDIDTLYELEENEDISEGERSGIEEFHYWLNCEGEELVDLLWNEDSLVTELPNTSCSPKLVVCAKMCNECPFSTRHKLVF